MKAGQEYEKFVYEKLKSFYKDFEVTFDDKIMGKESKIERQIDTSVKGKVNGIDLLYLVQCKDHARPADITKIGEFSSVIRDVGASKGFLVCAGGFAKTIHDYAQTHGIELITVEDINSEKWKILIQIPIVYVKHQIDFEFSTAITANEELAKRNKEPIQVTKADFKELSLDAGKTMITVGKHIDNKIRALNVDISSIESLDLGEPNLLLKFAGVWVPLNKFQIIFKKKKNYYLKYVSPDEYSQITDHLRKGVLPLSLSLKDVSFKLDETYVQVEEKNIPVFTNFNFEIEEKPGPFESADFNLNQFKMQPIR